MARRTRTRKTRKMRGGGPFGYLKEKLFGVSPVVPQTNTSTQPVPVEDKKQSLMSGFFGLFTKKSPNTPAASAPATAPAAKLVNMKTGNSPAGAPPTGAPPTGAPPASSASAPLAGGRRHRKRRTLRKKSKKTRRSRK